MTKKELEDVKRFLLKTKNFRYDFGNYSKMYSMTTENIAGFLNNYDLKNKKILTVAGSGDQRLNAYLMGANDITCFDVNPFCELHLDLKDTAIKTLSYEDFINFFGINNNERLLNKDIFDKFKSYLEYDTYYFYDFIINNLSNIGPKSIYYDFDNKLSLMKVINNYISPDKYNKLANILRKEKLNFLNINVDNLSDELNGEKFDFILLSNISDYTNFMYPDNDLEKYRDLIDKLIDNLNLYGVIQVGYIYNRYSKYSDISRFHINAIRQEYFPTDIFHTVFVNSYYNDGTYDKIITYQKFK